MTPPKAKLTRARYYFQWLLLAILLTFSWCVWGLWRVWDVAKAGDEALELGWTWVVNEPSVAIRNDWKAAFRKATWQSGRGEVRIPSAEEYDKHRDLVRRLHPRQLTIFNASKWHDLSALEDLTSLEYLDLSRCTGLTNVDGVKGLSGLQWLGLSDCNTVTKESVDALKAALPATVISSP